MNRVLSQKFTRRELCFSAPGRCWRRCWWPGAWSSSPTSWPFSPAWTSGGEFSRAWDHRRGGGGQLSHRPDRQGRVGHQRV